MGVRKPAFPLLLEGEQAGYSGHLLTRAICCLSESSLLAATTAEIKYTPIALCKESQRGRPRHVLSRDSEVGGTRLQHHKEHP